MYHRKIEVFVSVADCGSFTKAAENLSISSTAVMKQMNLLEEHLGMELLVRTNHGIRLTTAGESIYKDAKFIMSYSQTAIRNARQKMEAKLHMLSVGTSLLNPCKAFMDLWSRVNDDFPQFKIIIVPFEDDHIIFFLS